MSKQFYFKPYSLAQGHILVLSGATNPGQSGPGSDENERVLHIPESSRITETTPTDCLASYPGHLHIC